MMLGNYTLFTKGSRSKQNITRNEASLSEFVIQGFSMTQLISLEVLSAIQHAEFCLNPELTKEEFLEGKVGGFMMPEDFKFEETVSTFQKLVRVLSYSRPLHWPTNFKSTMFTDAMTLTKIIIFKTRASLWKDWTLVFPNITEGCLYCALIPIYALVIVPTRVSTVLHPMECLTRVTLYLIQYLSFRKSVYCMPEKIILRNSSNN